MWYIRNFIKAYRDAWRAASITRILGAIAMLVLYGACGVLLHAGRLPGGMTGWIIMSFISLFGATSILNVDFGRAARNKKGEDVVSVVLLLLVLVLSIGGVPIQASGAGESFLFTLVVAYGTLAVIFGLSLLLIRIFRQRPVTDAEIGDGHLTRREIHKMRRAYAYTKIFPASILATILFTVWWLLGMVVLGAFLHYKGALDMAVMEYVFLPCVSVSLLLMLISGIGPKAIISHQSWSVILAKLQEAKFDGHTDTAPVSVMAAGRLLEQDGHEALGKTAQLAGGAAATAEAVSVIGGMGDYIRGCADRASIKLPNMKPWILVFILVPCLVMTGMFVVGGREAVSTTHKAEALMQKRIDETRVVFEKHLDRASDAEPHPQGTSHVSGYLDDDNYVSVDIEPDGSYSEVYYNIRFPLSYGESDKLRGLDSEPLVIPSKAEAEAIIEDRLTQLNAALQELKMEDDLKTLYLPSEEFKEDLLASEEWDSLYGDEVGGTGSADEHRRRVQHWAKWYDLGTGGSSEATADASADASAEFEVKRDSYSGDEARFVLIVKPSRRK